MELRTASTVYTETIDGTEAMRVVWSEDNRLQKHLDVEAALALAERVSPALNNTVNHRKEE